MPPAGAVEIGPFLRFAVGTLTRVLAHVAFAIHTVHPSRLSPPARRDSAEVVVPVSLRAMAADPSCCTSASQWTRTANSGRPAEC